MQPALPVPTDNIYKFACLFGLVLIVSGIFAFVASYSASLDRKVKYAEVVIPLQAKSPRTKAEDEILAMHSKLIEVTQANERVANIAIGIVMGFGLLLSTAGAGKWSRLVQRRDDTLADLQVRKLTAEVAKLEAEVRALGASANNSGDSAAA